VCLCVRSQKKKRPTSGKPPTISFSIPSSVHSATQHLKHPSSVPFSTSSCSLDCVSPFSDVHLPPPRIKKEAPPGEVESLLADQDRVLRVPPGPASGAMLRSIPKNLESLPPQDQKKRPRKKQGAEEDEEDEMLTPFHFLGMNEACVLLLFSLFRFPFSLFAKHVLKCGYISSQSAFAIKSH
jgi:hypothetical protein